MYSFIKPYEKPLIGYVFRIWFFFTIITLIILLGFDMILGYKINSFEKSIISNNKKQTQFLVDIETFKKKIKLLNKEKSFAKNVETSNKLLEESLKNFFELIPEQITLNKIIIDKNSLTIFGITPSKDIYNLLLAPPLKSIFSKSVVDFYLQDNGWYRFVSKNESKIVKKEDNN